MTTWLLGNYPDRWRAGVAGDAVTDHLDQYVLSDWHSEVATYFEGCLQGTGTNNLCCQHQGTHTDTPQHRRPTRTHNRVFQALPHPQGQGSKDKVHRLPYFRSRDLRSCASARFR